MRAIQFVGPREIKMFDDYPKPEAKPGEVLVQCKYVSLCGSNMGQYTGEGLWADIDFPNPVGWAGHENIGVIVLTGAGENAFCSGGDQRIRGDAGYVDKKGINRLNVLDFQRDIRSCPKPVIAMVAGYAIGGGHVLHVVCDLTIAAENARFGQTGPKVGSFDGGFGSSYLARMVGQKKAREIWFLCRQYSANEALEMGMVNIVVPLDQLENTTVEWCREILNHSPLALRCIKSAMNADCDGQAGLQELAGNATLLYYMTEEGQEGRDAYVQKRTPNFEKFPRRP